MPKPSFHILELAKRGAEHRYRELKAELAALVKMFPHLGSAVSPAMPARTNEVRTPVRRRRMSPAARKAVSQRMKRYWAKRRKAKRASRKTA